MSYIRVRQIQTGQTGTMPEENFDPSKYEIIETPESQEGGGFFNDPIESLGQVGLDLGVGLGKAAARPFVDLFTRKAPGLGYEIGRATLSERNPLSQLISQIPGMAERRNPAYSTQNLYSKENENPFLTEEELDPLDFGMGVSKDASQIAALLMGGSLLGQPTGLSVSGGPFLQGAASGGLFEAGSPDATAGSITGATLLGGTLGKLLGLGGKGNLADEAGKIGPLSRAGRTLRKGSSRMQAPGVKGPLLEDDLLKLENELGLAGSAARKRQQVAQNQLKLESLSDDIAKASPVKYNLKDNISDIYRRMEFEGKHFIPEDATYRNQLIRDLKRLAKLADKDGNIPIGEVNKFKLKLGSEVTGSWDSPASIKSQVKRDLWDILDQDIASKAKGEPKLKDVTTKMSKLRTLQSNYDKAEGKGGVPVPLFGRVPGSANPVQAGQDRLGKTLMSANDQLANLFGILPDDAVRTGAALAPQIPDALNQEEEDESLPDNEELSSLIEFGVLPGGDTEETTAETVEEEAADDTETIDGLPAGMTITPEMVAMGHLILSKNDAAKLQKAYDVQKEGGGNKTAAEKNRALILNQAAPVLERIVGSALDAPTGVEGYYRSQIGKIPGVEGGEAEFLRRDIEGFARLIASAFASEVGVATDRDVERWKSIMPQPGDTEEERKRQSRHLIKQIRDEAKSLNIPVPDGIERAARRLAE